MERTAAGKQKKVNNGGKDKTKFRKEADKMKQIKGGVTAAKGFEAASTAAGIKYTGRTDMALIYSQMPCAAAGTFTTNVVKAAPVR